MLGGASLGIPKGVEVVLRGQGAVTIDGERRSRLLSVWGVVGLEHVRLSAGRAEVGLSGISVSDGAAVGVAGNATAKLTSCTISDSSVEHEDGLALGGAIFVSDHVQGPVLNPPPCQRCLPLLLMCHMP